MNSNNNNKQQFFVSQLALFGILFGIVLIISLLLPFAVSLVAILGVFVLRNMYRRRLMMKRIAILVKQEECLDQCLGILAVAAIVMTVHH
ncbi:MAG: hypothetical protein ACJ71K_05380 [Nitrososphaeraceae archaeon]